MQAAAGGTPLSAEVRAALRESVAALLLKAKADAAAEVDQWRARACAAEADRSGLQERLNGLLSDLVVERDGDLHAALRAVASTCRPLQDADGAEAHERFLRQGA